MRWSWREAQNIVLVLTNGMGPVSHGFAHGLSECQLMTSIMLARDLSGEQKPGRADDEKRRMEGGDECTCS